jgi:hypothetical protein
MKRKLDQDDVPAEVSSPVEAKDDGLENTQLAIKRSKKIAKTSAPVGFKDLGLDSRLLQGIVKLGFATPTLVQEKAIPLALEGKDILGRFILALWGCILHYFEANDEQLVRKQDLERQQHTYFQFSILYSKRKNRPRHQSQSPLSYLFRLVS